MHQPFVPLWIRLLYAKRGLLRDAVFEFWSRLTFLSATLRAGKISPLVYFSRGCVGVRGVGSSRNDPVEETRKRAKTKARTKEGTGRNTKEKNQGEERRAGQARNKTSVILSPDTRQLLHARKYFPYRERSNLATDLPRQLDCNLCKNLARRIERGCE